MKTQQKIDEQIEGLVHLKTTLPQKSIFGDDNYAKIDAQISVLKGENDPDDFYVDEGTEEYQDGDNDIYHDAYCAQEWMDGDVEEDLF